MSSYILGRLFQSIVSLLVVSFVVFFAIRLSGNPLDMMLSEYATPEERIAMAQRMGLDKPVFVQYGIFLTNAVKGDFGDSIRARRPALELALSRLPASLELGALAMLLSVIMALPLGVYAAVHRGGLVDMICRLLAVLGQSMPTFWLGLILMLIFAVSLNLLPATGRGGPQHLILPAFTMALYVTAGIMRLTRSAMLEVMSSEYIKLARIKGLHEFFVVWKHGFKNAVIPVLTFSVVLFVGMLAGAVITETVFAWPGLGRLIIEAVQWRDYPVVQTTVLIFSTIYLTANFIVDILYFYLDPRIRKQI